MQYSTSVAALLLLLLYAFWKSRSMTAELRRTKRELAAAKSQLVQFAATDELTGCHSRRFLEQAMTEEMHRHRTYELPLSILFIDIDHFKSVNKALGHDI